ncbi:MAG: hypothetical protein A2X71_00755 [Thiobacillus sp. GWE1_62_9]|nr:MAG: hypothetical protein A2X71_00755 [Thiobacillus sp. GWE1_62_9]
MGGNLPLAGDELRVVAGKDIQVLLVVVAPEVALQVIQHPSDLRVIAGKLLMGFGERQHAALCVAGLQLHVHQAHGHVRSMLQIDQIIVAQPIDLACRLLDAPPADGADSDAGTTAQDEEQQQDFR